MLNIKWTQTGLSGASPEVDIVTTGDGKVHHSDTEKSHVGVDKYLCSCPNC